MHALIVPPQSYIIIPTPILATVTSDLPNPMMRMLCPSESHRYSITSTVPR